MRILYSPDPYLARQHEATKKLLTRYSHEKAYRLRDTLANPQEIAAGVTGSLPPDALEPPADACPI